MRTVVAIEHHNEQEHKTRILQDDDESTQDHQRELHTRPGR
jgi:hypothetical protein